MADMKRTLLLTVAFLSGAAFADSPLAPLAWRANGDAVIAESNGCFRVRTGTSSPWGGGIRFTLTPRPEWRRFSGLELAVSNTLDRVQVFQTRFVHPGTDRDVKAATRNLTLAPSAAGTVFLPFAPRGWRLDRPLPTVGMRGTPDAGELDAPVELHAHVIGDERPGGFALLAVRFAPLRPEKVVPADGFLPFVDVYGQFKHLDWPEKIHAPADFKSRREAEERDLAAHPAWAIPEADRFGGWAKGPQLKATGRFRTEKINGRWQLVDPDGHLFFSQGITCVNAGDGESPYTGREAYFDPLPSADDAVFAPFHSTCRKPAVHLFYNAPSNCPFSCFAFFQANLRRKYGEGWKTEAADHALRRLRSWGFNSVGNWSESTVLSRAGDRPGNPFKTPYFVNLSTARAPRLMSARVGYWGRPVDPTTDEFRHVVADGLRGLAADGVLDDPYLIGVFVDNEMTWGDLSEEHCERYFSVIREEFDSLAPRTLYLGCRFAEGNEEMGPRRAWLAAARHCHVLSVNRYKPYPWIPQNADGIDLPIIVGEYHFGSAARGALAPGLLHGGDETARAGFFTRFVEAALDDRRIVGCHWFQWCDQPLSGRALDGENYQCGFVDVCDTPYAALVDAARRLAKELYARRTRPAASETVMHRIPRAISCPF